MYGNEAMLHGRRRRARIRAVQMDNLRGLLGIRRKDRVPNARIRQLYRVKKGLDERIDESLLRWFGHVQRMERDRIAKRVYVGNCDGSYAVSGLRKRWIDIMKDCLRNRFRCQTSEENGAE